MALQAIDVHTHVNTPDARALNPLRESMEKYFKTTLKGVPLEETAGMYRKREMKAVVFSIDAETATGVPYIGNDYVADMVRQHPDVFIGFASVDPHKGKRAVAEVERSARELSLKGVKFQQAIQDFYPNDRKCYPIYEKCAELGLPVVFHMGHTGVGAGIPGGAGIRLDQTRPIPCLDDVARDFPELTLIGAHPGWPWHDELLSVVLHKANVYMDLSGWSPKYFPPSVIQYANTLLQDKVLFGTDYPLLTPERWLRDFEAAPFKEEVRKKILLENARKVLKIDAS
ncbi:MAG: amidohydrolase [Candidatus Tectomicrobia bacterium]|nr:amidohydrolase [Candidatus Tectomicrobia bacterium]